jgi:hypothetical protein
MKKTLFLVSLSALAIITGCEYTKKVASATVDLGGAIVNYDPTNGTVVTVKPNVYELLPPAPKSYSQVEK